MHLDKFKVNEWHSLNPKLIKKQKINNDDLKQLVKLHQKRWEIEKAMEEKDSIAQMPELFELYDLWTVNEYALQIMWKFECNPNMHRDYMVPHCLCPKWDNDDVLGTDLRYRMSVCPFHGQIRTDRP